MRVSSLMLPNCKRYRDNHKLIISFQLLGRRQTLTSSLQKEEFERPH